MQELWPKSLRRQFSPHPKTFSLTILFSKISSSSSRLKDEICFLKYCVLWKWYIFWSSALCICQNTQKPPLLFRNTVKSGLAHALNFSMSKNLSTFMILLQWFQLHTLKVWKFITMVWIALEKKYDHPNKLNNVKQSYYFFLLSW